MKVALVHYWLVGMRGGEKVLESLCRMFPEADIYTHVAIPERLSDTIRRHKITETFIARLPFARTWYPRYLPLMPLALEALDLTGYDLIISSEAGPAKGVIPGPNTIHLSYCHSPMRYIWDQYYVYRQCAGLLTRILLPFIAHYIRVWDTISATRVDLFIANSHFVSKRIKKYYRREASVVHPPVMVDEFVPVPPSEHSDYYLWCGELVSYKRPDIAIEAFNVSRKPLIIIGDGEQRSKLQTMAKPNIVFLGKAPFEILKHHAARCRALIFPGEEDFGIVPLEVQASGRPVIAYAKGGALETVIDGKTGVFFTDASATSLNEAIERFEESDIGLDCEVDCRNNALRFSESAFVAGMKAALISVNVDAAVRLNAKRPQELSS